MTKLDILKSTLQAKGLPFACTRGNPSAPICFVGEALGEEEAKQGLPFVGASGRELERMINEAGLSLNNCWFTNPYMTRPPDNKLDRLHELSVPVEVYLDAFWEVINTHRPTFVCALGATPLGILCPFTINKRTQTAAISQYRGSLLRSPSLGWNHYVVPSFHPAFLFRSWDERQNAVLCLAKLNDEFNYWREHRTLQPLPQRQLISDPPADDAIDFLTRILQTSASTVVSIDIESIGVYRGEFKTPQRNRVPYVIGFSIDPGVGISIGLTEYERNKTAEIWRLVDKILTTKRQLGHNYYTYDIPWLSYIGFSVNTALIEDTLVLHHSLWPELSHKLEYLTFQYCREPFYKNEGKSWTVKEKDKLKKYNCKDVCVTLQCWNEMQKELVTRCVH